MSILPTRYVTVEEECKRNSKLKKSDLQIFKDWLYKQPHLPHIDDFYLVYFLHSNYYHIEPSKRTIDNFYTIRTHFPEVFSNIDPIGWKELRKAFTVVDVAPLEQKSEEGDIMIFGKLHDTDPNKCNIYEVTKYFFMSFELHNVVNGVSMGHIVILDALGVSLSHVALLNLMYIKKLFYYIQEAAPVLLKAIHILNTTPIVQTMFNMVKPFIKVEVLKIIHFHSSLETVKKCLPIEALPNEYGGQAGTIEELTAKNIKLLEDNREWFQYSDHIGRVNESLRIDKLSNSEGLFGVDGNFKKIEID